jgi:hypothetical protein
MATFTNHLLSKGIEFKKIEARHSTRMDMLRWQHTEDAEIPWGGP